MTDIICKIKIKIKDYYPKLKIIPYYNYECLIYCQEQKIIIPLKNIENMFLEYEPENINSDLIYNISLITKDKRYLISKSSLTIAYNRIIQVIEMKTLKFEQQIKLLLENDIKEKIFGPGISVGSIFIKFIIEINSSKGINSNISLIYDNIYIRNNNSKSRSKFKNNLDINQSSSVINISTVKKNLKLNEISQNKGILSTKYSTQKSYEQANNFTSIINKQNSNKNEYIYTQTSPFALKHYYNNKNQSAQLFNNKKSKKKYLDYNCYSPPPQNKLQKFYSKEIVNNNFNLKRYCSKPLYTNKKNLKINNNTEGIISNFGEICIKEKKPPKSQKRFVKKLFSKEIDNNFRTIHLEENIIKIDDNIQNHKSIEINKTKNEKIHSISKKLSYKNSQKSVTSKKIEKKNSKISTDADKSKRAMTKKNSLKSKTSKSFYKIKEIKNRNQKIKIEENKTLEPKINSNENKNKKIKIKINYINPVNNNEDLKNNLLTLIDYLKKSKKEMKNYNNIFSKYLLYREKIVFENKKKFLLQKEDNEKNIKNFIHVKINSKLNNVIFKKMTKIKIKEINIIKIIINNRKKNEQNDPKKIIEEKLKQQKQMHVLLNITRELIKNYGNLSHLYDEDNNKKILLKSLFLRYNIREKEWNDNDNLLEMYNKFINEVKIKNNKEKNQDKLKIEEFKTIKEEEENENEEDDEIKEPIKEEKNDNEEENSNEKNNKEGKITITNEQNIKDTNNNINKENINFSEKNLFEINENLINDNINFDKNTNTNNINNDLLNNGNIIINNIIINK